MSNNNSISENVFLDSWDNGHTKDNVIKDGDGFWKYIRRFFLSSMVILLWLLAILFLYTFRTYVKESRTPSSDPNNKKIANMYLKVKNFIWSSSKTNYEAPIVWASDEQEKVDKIINATDLDYGEKKDLLDDYVLSLVRTAEDNAVNIDNLKQSIAKQWFLPEELGTLLSEDQAIDTIQRSLNALEVIRFSTATKVFSYMNTALSMISEMIRVSWASVEELRDLFEKLSLRWENDISSYVYMCYLNPFETNANCDIIWDFDLYYDQNDEKNPINIELFKNAMNAIGQLLERQDTSLFSITFNWFNAADKSIKFNVEVYTNQEDERVLMSQWKRNPNVFILTNIINLLKQSSFIIWAEINPKEINVYKRSLNQWGVSRTVNYSTMDFTVPIQKNTEREIFDYINLDSMEKLLLNRWFDSKVLKVAEKSSELDIVE